jgi:hypothetical protein
VQLSALSTQLAALESSSRRRGLRCRQGAGNQVAIRNGSLIVDAQVVAEKMLTGLQEMFGKVK